MRGSLAVRVHSLGIAGGLDTRTKSRAFLSSRKPVIGELRRGSSHGVLTMRVQGLGDRPVQPLTDQHVRVDRFTQQRVAERISGAARALDQHVVIGRLPQRGKQLPIADPDHAREQAMVDRSTDDRRDPSTTRVSSDNRSTRNRSAWRTGTGSWPPPAAAVPSNSSAKNGLPSQRTKIRSSTATVGTRPEIASSCSATSERASGSSSTRSARPDRSSSATNGVSG